MRRLLTSLVLVTLTLAAQGGHVKDSPYTNIINELFQKIGQEQAQETLPFVVGEQMYHKKGVYASHIKQNFHGSFQMAEARRTLGCYDNNMFATAWVTSSLIESYLHSNSPKPSENQIKISLDSFDDHHDHNRKYNNSLMTFWEQAYDKNVSYWQSSPYNIKHVLDLGAAAPWTEIEQVLKALGLEHIGEAVKHMIDDRGGYFQAFHIPPDFDDTFVNMGLGSLLYSAQKDFPDAWDTWRSQNTNLTASVFDALKKYAYRPFSDDRNVNSMDPRTYVWLRKFLDQAKSEGRTVTVVPTWIQNLEELEGEYHKGVIMPFEINNVDATVAANTIFGMTSAITSGLVSPTVLDDPDIEALYHNTSRLLQWEINTNMTNRPDLTLLYYPSEVEFDWFVARTFATLDTKRKQGPLPRPVMEEVYQMLKQAVEGEMTRYILFKGEYDGLGHIYYDDFLGDGDLTPENKTLKRAEDRIFTTAMAANALMYTWTSVNETTKTVTWRPTAPDVVRKQVKGIMDWLTYNVLGKNFDPWNAFFSGSFKGPTTWPDYPYNVAEFLNGTALPPHSHDWHTPSVRCVRGYIDEAIYEKEMIAKKSPTVFNGYNADPGNFPYWSSTGYTYSISLMVFSRYESLLANEST